MEDQASDTGVGNAPVPRWSIQQKEKALLTRRQSNYRPEPLEQTLIQVVAARQIHDNRRARQNERPNRAVEVVDKKRRRECRQAVGTGKTLE